MVFLRSSDVLFLGFRYSTRMVISMFSAVLAVYMVSDTLYRTYRKKRQNQSNKDYQCFHSEKEVFIASNFFTMIYNRPRQNVFRQAVLPLLPLWIL